MVLSRSDAYELLELPIGADRDSIRTHYKRLAQRWHPEKHDNTPDVRYKFQQISVAYKRLDTDNENIQMTISDCLELYQRMLHPNLMPPCSNGFHSSDDDDSDVSVEFHFGMPSNGRPNSLSPEEIEKNASELLSEVEKEKRRAEKRKAKKKRRREKKRQEKSIPGSSESSKANASKGSKQSVGASGDMTGAEGGVRKPSTDEAEGFDTSAAFFTQVKNKKKPGAAGDAPTKSTAASHVGKAAEDNIEDLDATVLRSRQLAIAGNEMANSGHYQEAIDMFTEAIKLDSSDFRFFGNRSYCFDRIQQYDRALKDGEKAISLSPDWPKGYFRKGRALAGLKRLPDAETAFLQVLKLDRNCDDAIQELMRVRTLQLTEMGFTQVQADQAIQQYSTVQAGLDALLAGVGSEWKVSDDTIGDDVYVSDEDDYNPGAAAAAAPVVSSYPRVTAPAALPASQPAAHLQHHPVTAAAATAAFTPASSHKAQDVKMDPNNPEGLSALWVGNVLPEVSQAKLQGLFAKYATVTSIRMLPEKYCAFVNLKTKEDAGRAMKHLQGFECAGQQLLIKFPDNPLSNGNLVIRKQTGATAATSNTKSSSAAAAGTRQTGPVNGNECYFWRTTGCTYGTDCHYKHIRQNKGIDQKSWQAKTS